MMKKLLTSLLIASFLLTSTPVYAKRWTSKPPVGSQIDWSHPLSRGLVACFLMNEGGGSKIYDIARRNNGTLINGATWKAGKRGVALNFDGTDDYVDVGSAIGKPTSWTITGWIKPTSIANNGIIFSVDTGGSNNNAWGVYGNSGNILSLYVSSGSDTQIFQIAGEYTAVNYPSTSWTFISGTINGTTISYYRNGNLIASTPQTISMGGTPYKISIGKYGEYTGSGYNFPGSIDDVRIYNRALSPTEIRKLYEDPYCFIKQSNFGNFKSGLMITADDSQVIMIM